MPRRDRCRPRLECHLTPHFAAARPARFLDKLLAINMRLKGAHLILPKVERMLAAHGMAPLSPLFDERLARLVFELPGHLKLHRGTDKVIFKRAYRGRIPDAVLDRPKSGMRVPVHFWFQGEMRRFAQRLLSAKALRGAGIFDERRVRELLRYESDRGPGRFGIRLWMLVTFELWRRAGGRAGSLSGGKGVGGD
ncbi:MAG: asparagine synthase-related protein [Verrucomicrobiales bacterium]